MQTAFEAANTRVLKKEGLAGSTILVSMPEGALELRGRDGGSMRITPSEVMRMRMGYVDGRPTHYQTLIARAGSATPITLHPLSAGLTGYSALIPQFAASVASAGGIEHIESGTSKFSALFAPVLLAPVVIGGLALSLFVLTDQPWWGRMLMPLIPTGIFAIMLYLGMRRHWPRRVQRLEELRAQVPFPE